MTTQTQTIKIDMSWAACARIYIEALENGTAEGKQAARDGIMEMAEKLDALKAEREDAEMDRWHEVAADADLAAEKLDRESAQAARKQHNCKVFSRGFEFLSLNKDGERDENVIDYCEREEITGEVIQGMVADCRNAGSTFLAIGYGVDAADSQADYDAGDYEPMFDWVDLPNVAV